MRKHFIDDLNRLHKLWSVRTALLWGAVSGAYAALPAFQEVLSPAVFAVLCVGMSTAIVGARVLKQPGAE